LQFLDEARLLAAASGVTSVLVRGTFPWAEDPDHHVDASVVMAPTAH
jgi:hypothetical protein